MPKINIPLLCLLPFLALFSCEKWDLEQQDFVQVEITSIDSLSIDSVRIAGRIVDLAIGQVQEHGFLWTSQDTLPSVFFNEGKQELGLKTKDASQEFSTIVNLAPNTRYTFRAYAQLNEKDPIYSESWYFHTGRGNVFTLEVIYQDSFDLDVSGRLSGTEKGLVALNHGFCWSSSNTEPNLEDDFVDLGNKINNEVFTYTYRGLQNNIEIHFRAYAIFSFDFKPDTVYGQPVTFNGDLNFWTRKADFKGGPRYSSIGFSIGPKGYVGLGYNGTSYERDFWEYDPHTDTWTQRADYSGEGRYQAVGISIGQKGYVGLGYSNNNITQNDFWEYDPLTDSWAQKADFGGGNRGFAVAFSIGEKGYVGMGAGGNDFWEYDPMADSWQQKADLSEVSPSSIFSFSIGSKGYIALNMAIIPDTTNFWEYDPLMDRWTPKANFPGGNRVEAFGFSIGAKGYAGTGRMGSSDRLSDFWEYDQMADTWARKLDVEGGAREEAFCFSIGQKGYVGTGIGTYLPHKQDLWEYDP